MARLNGHLRQTAGVSLAALVAAGLPALALDGAEAATDTAAVVFYTPLDGGATPGTFHVLMGAPSNVTTVRLSYVSKAGTTTQTIERKDGSNVFETSSPSLTGAVELQATALDATDTIVGTVVTEDVTVAATASTFTFVRPAPSGAPLGVFRRADGRSFTRASGTTTGTVEPSADDPEADAVLPPSSLPAPTGGFDTAGRIFREPVDLSGHTGLAVPGRAVIRVRDNVSSQAVEAPLYLQTVTTVTATTAPVPGTDNVTVTARATDQLGLPVVGAPVRLTGYANGSRTALSQVGVTDAVDGVVTFTGPGAASGPAAATGYSAGFYTAYVDLNLDGRRGAREAGAQSVVGTVAFAAPGKSLFHSDARIRGAGGVLNDSLRGTRLAAARHYEWIDQDGQLSYASRAALRAGAGRVSQPAHLTWVNAHGAPYNPRWLGRGRFENRAWSGLRRRPGLRNAEMAFKQNAAYHLSVEWEVKDIKPFTTTAALNAAFANLADVARRYYGSAWTSRVHVKMLSNLSGGPAFALRVLQVAHAHGFTTIYLARDGAARTQIPAAAHAYVDYVRGAVPGLYATPVG